MKILYSFWALCCLTLVEAAEPSKQDHSPYLILGAVSQEIEDTLPGSKKSVSIFIN